MKWTVKQEQKAANIIKHVAWNEGWTLVHDDGFMWNCEADGGNYYLVLKRFDPKGVTRALRVYSTNDIETLVQAVLDSCKEANIKLKELL